jgi:hypothetical protein
MLCKEEEMGSIVMAGWAACSKRCSSGGGDTVQEGSLMDEVMCEVELTGVWVWADTGRAERGFQGKGSL